MKGVVVAASMMLIIVGIDLVSIAPGPWFLVGDILILTGLCVFSALVYRA